ncbi:DUF1565 domain-containing protein [Candidatus Micrarchaeota archaeon]|nr:DUF1565 domain-containing protein [Candidatus Micrarchaeota archaeon]
MTVSNRSNGNGMSEINSSMSRGQFLRTAGMIGGAAAITGLGLGGVARAQSFEPKTYYVNMPPYGSDANPGTYEQPFATIQYAVDYASDGDTIMVLPGYYQGAVLGGNRWPADSVKMPGGKKSLNIIGSEGTVINRGVMATSTANEAAFFIAPSGNFTTQQVPGQPPTLIQPPRNKADGTTISNFVIDGNNWQGLKPFALGVFAQGAKNLTVSHLTIYRAQQAISFSGCSFCAATHNTIQGLFAPISNFPTERGIYVGSNNNGECEGNFIGFNKIYATDVLAGTWARERVGIYYGNGVVAAGTACPVPPGPYYLFFLPVKNSKIVHNQVEVSIPAAYMPTPPNLCPTGNAVPCYNVVSACHFQDGINAPSTYYQTMGWRGTTSQPGYADNSVGFNDFRGSTNALSYSPISPLPYKYPCGPSLVLNFTSLEFPNNNDITKNFGLSSIVGIGEDRSVTNDNIYEGTTGFVPVLNQQTCEETGNQWVQDPVTGEWYCK